MVIHGTFPYIGWILIWLKFYKPLWVKRYKIEWLHGTRIIHRSYFCMIFFAQVSKFGTKPEVVFSSLHRIHSASEGRENLRPSSCCCFGVSRFHVGLQLCNLFSIQKNFSFLLWSPWLGTVKVGSCSLLKRVERGGVIQAYKFPHTCCFCLLKKALLERCSSDLQLQINGSSGHAMEQAGLLIPQCFS